MSIAALANATGLPVNVASVSTVGDMVCGGDLTVSGTLNAANLDVDLATIKGDLLIEEDTDSGELGQIHMGRNPEAIKSERLISRDIISSYDDPGLVGDGTCAISMTGLPPDGLPGRLQLKVQNGSAVPGSELLPVLTCRGASVGIGNATTDPMATLHCTESVSFGSGYAPYPDKAMLTMRHPDSTSGFVFQQSPTNFSSFNYNVYLDGADNPVFTDASKVGWRYLVDQRGAGDSFVIDSVNDAGSTSLARAWLSCSAVTGQTTISDTIKINNDGTNYRIMQPTVNAFTDVGSLSFQFRDGYFSNPSSITSDVNMKHDIDDLPVSRGLSLVESIRPVQYRYNNGTSGRLHYGFIAQEVEETMKSSLGDVVGLDNAIVVKGKKQIPDPDYEGEDPSLAPLITTDEDIYSLRYTELIAVLAKSIQELSAKVTVLQNGKTSHSTRITRLESFHPPPPA